MRRITSGDLRQLPADAVADIHTVKQILRAHGATRIVFYGSFSRGDYRHDSDIDICFEGIPDDRYFHAVAECLLRTRRTVTPIALENARGTLRSRILQEGKVIYERRKASRRSRVRS
ncbi:MAG: nucleotidyltransferase domain-containing protein [Chthonomonadetes bacterium]|nr:nucleotidyltransferase domain-containing protein [Chthonomonadetes bacterium]